MASGELRVPAILALNGYHLMLGHGLGQLTKKQKAVAMLGSLSILLGAMKASPSFQPRTFLVRTLNPLAALLATWGLPSAIEREALQQHDRAMAQECAEIEDERLAGYAEVLGFAEKILDDAWMKFHESAFRLPSDISEEVHRRLVDAQRRCEMLRQPDQVSPPPSASPAESSNVARRGVAGA